MKKLGILSVLALLLMGTVACGGDGGSGDGNDSTATATPATPPVDPATQPPAPTEPVIDLPITTAAFTAESHEFGEIKEGEKVVHEFKFKNTGTGPLKVYNVKPSCGCTTPDWTKEEVPPGGEGFIKVEFDSKGKTGTQKKSVTVTMNTEPKTKVLNFSGEVVGGPAAPAEQPH